MCFLTCVWVVVLAICFQQLQSQVTSDDIVTAVDRVKEGYKKCRGDYDLMFSPTIDMHKLETIAKMFESASAELAVILKSVGELVSKVQQIPSQPSSELTNPAQSAIIPTKFLKPRDHISGILVVKDTKFERYRQSRKTLKLFARMLVFWIENPSDPTPYHEFVEICVSSNNMINWLEDLKTDLDTVWYDGDFVHWLMATANNSRSDLTRFISQLKSDICEATLLLSACESAKNSSQQVKAVRFNVVNSTLEVFKNRFADVDKTIMTTARANLIADIREYIKPISLDSRQFITDFRPIVEIFTPQFRQPIPRDMQNITLNYQTDTLYEKLALKYYWLNLNVALYEYNSNVEVTYSHADESDCVIYERVTAANNYQWDVIVYTWKKSLSAHEQVNSAEDSRATNEEFKIIQSDKQSCKMDIMQATKGRDSDIRCMEWYPCSDENFGAQGVQARMWMTSLVATAHRSDSKAVHHSGTVGAQIQDATHMLLTKVDECSRSRKKIVYFIASSCPDDPFTFP